MRPLRPLFTPFCAATCLFQRRGVAFHYTRNNYDINPFHSYGVVRLLCTPSKFTNEWKESEWRERRVTKKCVSIYIEREREEEWGERAKDRLERVV